MYSDAIVAVPFSGRPIGCSTRESRHDARGERSRLTSVSRFGLGRRGNSGSSAPRATGWTRSPYLSTSASAASHCARQSASTHVSAQLAIEAEEEPVNSPFGPHVTVERHRHLEHELSHVRRDRA
jgi:hypothetical protein